MRCTRLRWMYLPRTPKKSEKEHPMQVQNAESFLKSMLMFGIVSIIAAAVMSLRQVQVRKRQSGLEVGRKRAGQRVVVIGAGAGGCAAAANITNASPEVHVTVIEKDRQHTFLGQVPLAHTGHRSYDLTTTTGMDVLRSPASWNVTREANLVAAEVLRVDPNTKQVFVRSTEAMLTAARPLSEEETAAEAARAVAAAPGLFTRWLRRGGSTTTHPTALSINEDGSHNLSDGTTVLAYDALVVAAGAQRTTGHLRSMIQPQQLDSYRVAVNPGTTRDSITSMFSGNVVHVKVPPASFVWQMEAARALITGNGAAAVPSTVDMMEQRTAMTTSTTTTTAAAAGATPAVSATAEERVVSWEDITLTQRIGSTVRGQWRDFKTQRAAVDDDGDGSLPDVAAIPDEVALRLASVTAPTATTTATLAALPLSLLSTWCMHFSSRQHESTFVSSTNTIWKFLDYYNKLSRCHLVAVTADDQPIGAAPRSVNRVIERFWRGRQLECRIGDGVTSEHFHVLYHAYVSAVDSLANTITLYDYKNNAEVRLPFGLLILDLPLRAPGFVRRSGLHRTNYIDECVRPALVEGTRAVAAASVAAESPLVRALQRHPLLGKTKAELEVIFADEASFMDVDPSTLQHRRYRDIFALGDIAGLPSVKGYGAVYAQVPVVAHNVRQVLDAQLAEAALKRKTAAIASGAPVSGSGEAAAATAVRLPRANARYTGYSSFHIVMTTWRAMWPEMEYTPGGDKTAAVSTDGSAATATTATATDAAVAEARKKGRYDLVTPLHYCDHHIWNNVAWRDVRGFLNALYLQSAVYDWMYFFVFTRAVWHPPSWFAVPTYSVEDGTPHVPSMRSLF